MSSDTTQTGASGDHPSDDFSDDDLDTRVAVIGMSGRFPGAAGVAALWRGLSDGFSGIREITDEELAAAHVPPAVLADPRYVRRGAPLDDVGDFDASFFGFNPREAEITDPQHRLFLECCWEALESAGYPPQNMPGTVGVVGGVGFSHYGLRHVLARPDVMATITSGQYGISTMSDSLCTMVAYKLGLTGPVLSVQTACSTSLVAVHVAVQSLLTYECDTVLAGGVSVEDPMPAGYTYEEGSILSPDGRARSLDADADGSVWGKGVGVVALKRLGDALRDGDHVHAVILGSAVNNDGADRGAYVAPSAAGQRAVIDGALSVAGIDSGTVDYVECHATGTRLGDAIELAAMDKAFSAPRESPLVLASVKPCIGHLDRASGVTGLIRAVSALEHRELPGTPGFRTPNPALAAASDRLRVLPANLPWDRGDHPRRAGVSSFGAGGTNAHVVLEEAPAAEQNAPGAAGPHVLTLSARTPAALAAAADRLRDHLADSGAQDDDLADIAYTLQISRTGFPYRLAVTCDTVADAVAALTDAERSRAHGPAAGGAPTTAPADRAEAARVWLAGADPDWTAVQPSGGRRVPLPTYPFERRRYFLDRVAHPTAGAGPAVPQGRLEDRADWFAHPVWHRLPAPQAAGPRDLRDAGPWWVLADGEVGVAAARLLREAGAEVTVLTPAGATVHGAQEGHAVDPACRDGFADLLTTAGRPRTVLHLWNTVGGDGGFGAADRFAAAQERGYYTVQALAGALATDRATGRVTLVSCTTGAVEAVGGDLTAPEQATLLGLARVISQEVGDIACRLVDIGGHDGGTGTAADILAARVLAESVDPDPAAEPVALRPRGRWVRGFEPLRLPAVDPDTRAADGPLREGATVVVTGGLGDVGAVLAAHLAATRSCNLVLTARTPLPPEAEWPALLAAATADDRAARHVRTVLRLREAGARVLAAGADIADREGMARVLDAARREFGTIDAVVHAAGVQSSDCFGPVVDLPRRACEAHFGAKTGGLRVLEDLLRPDEAPVRIAVSSISSLLGGLAHGPYAAANAGLDALTQALACVAEPGSGTAGWLTVDWDSWLVGERTDDTLGATVKGLGMSGEEGVDIFERTLALHGRTDHLVVSIGPLDQRLAQWTGSLDDGEDAAPEERHPRPPLSVPYEEPVGETETALAGMWGDILGIDGVGAHDSFFDLGGHSLAAVRLMARVRTAFGGMPADTLLAHPTVRAFGKELTAARAAAEGAQR
ncbi:SDR family oxidoreductase [Streptomyces bohaiensis]|uniref:SDR family oxidoreductase n=1 Tax=Streptomyces bohaiensis TaxID=1431344 RepID=UPI003B7E71A2